MNHRPRTSGRSKYGLGRIPRVLMDLLTVQLLAKFRDRPMRLFGYVGGAGAAGAAAMLAAAVCQLAASARLWGSWGMALSEATPLFVFSLLLLQLSLLTLCLGFLAEMVMRTYFESQPRSLYRVREVVKMQSQVHE